jgi:2-isopropylmalate synthase
VGRTYEAVIRVNSQSGKGGVAYILRAEHQLDLPRRLQIEFSRVIQTLSEGDAGEIDADTIWSTFQREYLERTTPYELTTFSSTTSTDGRDQQVVDLVVRGEAQAFKGEGNGPVDAFVDGMRQAGAEVRVLDYSEHALSAGGDALAAAYVECEIAGEIVWGVGIDANIVRASLKAVVSAANRAEAVTIPV